MNKINYHSRPAMFPYVPIRLIAKRTPPPGYPKELKTLGDHLRKKRLDLGLSQKEMAVRLCVSVGTLYNWEKSLTSPQRLIPRIQDFSGYCLLLPVEIRPQLVQAPVLHGLGDMRRTDFLAAGEIGDRAGHAQNAIHCPS